jgi:hypothetical protein
MVARQPYWRKMVMRWLPTEPAEWASVIGAFIGIVLLIIPQFGVISEIPDSLHWKLVYGLSAVIFFVLYAIRKSMDNNLNKILSLLPGCEVKRFASGDEQMAYLIYKISIARRFVNDCSWVDHDNFRHRGLDRRRESERNYQMTITKQAKSIQYREIFVVDTEHQFPREDRLQRLSERMGNTEITGYSCSYFLNTPIPRLQFMVIDHEEVILHHSDGAPRGHRFAICHSGIAALFGAYYNDCWNRSTKLKEGTIVHQDKYEELLRQVTRSATARPPRPDVTPIT